MAYLVNHGPFDPMVAGTTVTGQLPSHQTNDLLIVHVAHRVGGGSWTETGSSGWAEALGASAQVGNSVWWKRAASSSEANPTFTYTGSSFAIAAYCYVIRGVPATGIIHATNSAESTSTANPFTFPTVTPSVANTLTLFSAATENDTPLQFDASVRQIYMYNDAGLNLSMAGGLLPIQPSGSATPAVNLYRANASSRQYSLITISISDDGSTGLPGHAKYDDSPADIIHPLWGAGNAPLGGVWQGNANELDPTTVIPTIEDVSAAFLSFANVTVPYPVVNALDYFPGAPQHSITSTSQRYLVNMAAIELGSGHPLYNTSGVDISNSVITFSAHQNRKISGTFGTPGGIFFGAISGDLTTGSGTMWNVEAGDSQVSGFTGVHPYVMYTGDVTNTVNGSGAAKIDDADLTNVTHLVVGFAPGANAFSNAQTTYLYAWRLNTFVAVGGSSAIPANFNDAYDWANSHGTLSVQRQSGQAAGQFYANQNIQIGSGDTDYPVYWRSIGQSIEYPSAYDADQINIHSNVPAATFELSIYASTSCTISLANTVVNGSNFHKFTEHPSTSDSASVYNYSGLVVLNSTVSLRGDKTNIVRDGATFSACKAIAHNASTTVAATTPVLEGVVVSSVASGETASIEDITTETQFANVVTGATFRNNTNAPAIRITGDQTGSWADPGLTVSGNTIDIEYTGTTAFSIQSAVPLTVNSTVTPGLLTIVTPTQALVINPDVTITGSIRYFDGSPDDQTPNDSGTGDSLSYTYSTTDSIDIEVVEQYYVPVNQQDVTPFNGTLNIEMDFDEAYNDSHGLTIVTHYTYNRATKVLNILADQNAFDVRSALADTIRTNSSYFNTKLLMVAIPGLARIDQTAGMTVADMSTWKRAGSEVFDAADSANPVKKYFAIQTVGTITGATTHYRQSSSGDSTAVTLTNNIVDESFLYYEDADHDGTPSSDLSGYALIKSFLAGSKQGRVDVLANAGISALQSTLYVVPLSNTAHDYAGTDPGISADLTLVTGGTVGGKTFAYKIVDGGTNTGANIAAQLNYNASANPNAVIPGGTGLRYFELPDMVIHNATAVETERGFREGATPTMVGFYVERGGADHPDFTRFQADDGTYYAPAVTANITITNLPDDVGGATRLQIYNVTTATEYYSDDPAGTGYSASYTDGVGITSGDSIRVRFAHVNGSTSFEYGETFTVASSSGFSVDGNNFIGADDVYAANAVDGSAVTKFVADFVNDEIDLAVNANFEAKEAYAYYCYTLTLAQGIEEFWGGVTAQDVGNYRINASVVSIYFDNTTTASKRQTDTARIYRSDSAYPVKDPTTSGFGIDVNWQNVVYVTTVTGSNVITGNITDVAAQVQSALTAQGYTTTRAPYIDDIKTKTDQLTFTTPNVVDASASVSEASIRSAIGMASANLDTQLATITADTNELQTNQGNWLTATGFATVNPDNASIAEILTDTGTTIPAIIAALNNLSSADVTASVPTVAEITTAIDALLTTDAIAEPTSPPASNAPLTQKIAWIFAMARNRIEQTETQQIVRADDGSTAIGTSSTTDDGTTAVRGEFG